MRLPGDYKSLRYLQRNCNSHVKGHAHTRSSNFVEPHTRTLSIPYHKCIILSLNDHFHGKLMSDSGVEDLNSKEEDRLAADNWWLSIMKLRCRGRWTILTSAIWMQQSSVRNSHAGRRCRSVL